MRKPEALSDKLWRSVSVSLPGRAKLVVQRYRGVILVVSIPIILILAVVMLVPRKSPLHYDQTHTVKELQHKSPVGAPGGSSSGKDVYAVVLDAGSTGSRVHVYRFAKINGENRLISDTFEQLKPGLSSYADDPKAAAQSLKPLLDKAVETVPKDLQASTPVSLKATAGLRLLPEGKAPKILEAVEEFLGTYPFLVNDGAVAILDGKDEGAFAWLTLNYLLGNLAGGDISKTVAAIDLGGGSVQEAFAVSDEEAKAAPEGYISKLKAGGKTFNVYVHSYLGYGLMASRAKVISGVQAAQGHPCFHKDVPATNYTYAGQDYPFRGHANAAHKACSATGQTALEAAKECGAVQVQCSFSGAWRGQPNVKAKPYFVSSYFWDRALESGIITDPTAVQWPTTPQAFGAKAEAACGKTAAEVSKTFPAVKPDQATFFCLDLSFSYTLLTKGFQLPESKTITLVKQVEYNGQNIEAAWPLGAAINDL